MVVGGVPPPGVPESLPLLPPDELPPVELPPDELPPVELPPVELPPDELLLDELSPDEPPLPDPLEVVSLPVDEPLVAAPPVPGDGLGGTELVSQPTQAPVNAIPRDA